MEIIPAARLHILTPLFDMGCALLGLGTHYRAKVIRAINAPNKPLRVLDAGCGTGSLALQLKHKRPKLHIEGIDADENILTIARKKIKNITLKKAYLQDLPYKDNHFDIIYSSLVLHHLNTKGKQETLRELHRTLKHEGTLIISDFAKPKHYIFAPLSWFTVLFEEGLDNYQGKIPAMLKEAGFEDIQKIETHRGTIDILRAKKFSAK